MGQRRVSWTVCCLLASVLAVDIADRSLLATCIRGSSCDASVELEHPAMLLAHHAGVLRVDLVDRTHVVLTNESSASGVDYHHRKNLLFWSDDKIDNSKIYVQPLATSNVSYVIAVNGPWSPVALAVDWVGDKLYVADQLGRKVDVFELDGRWHAVVLSANLSSPTGIALDPTAGLMFVADSDQIVRANMDGTRPKTIISEATGTHDSFGIVVDTIGKKIYFSSLLLDSIETSDYNGNFRSPILKNQQVLWSPMGLAVFEDKVFWSDNVRRRISSVNHQHPSTIEEIFSTNDMELYDPKALTVVHSRRQAPATNPCGNDNGGCSQLCLVTALEDGAVGYRCACQVGFTISSDLKNCDTIEEFLVYSRQSIIQGKALKPVLDDFNDAILIDVSMSTRFIGLDFDSQDEYVYYSEAYENMIYKIHRNGTGREIILSASNKDGLQAEGLAVDWVSKNLYYVQSLKGTLNVLSTKNKAYKRILLKDLKRPRAVVVHPNKGYIFFSEWGTPARISRANTDGSGLLVFDRVTLGWPNGLAIDYDDNRVYWCDGSLHRVQHANLNGNDIQTIQSRFLKHPFSIVIHKEFMYITDWKTYALMRFDKLSGGEERILVEEHPTKRLFGVKVYSKNDQRIELGHPCADDECQKFCFGIPRKNTNTLVSKCGCSDGEAVAPDGFSCVIETSLGLCPKTAFTCRNDRCLPQSWACDGYDDCSDSSDEEHCTKI